VLFGRSGRSRLDSGRPICSEFTIEVSQLLDMSAFYLEYGLSEASLALEEVMRMFIMRKEGKDLR